MAALAAARACPESMSRSEPASAAGTGQWVSRRGLACSCEEGGKQTERATQSKAVTHRHFGTRGGMLWGCHESRGKRCLQRGLRQPNTERAGAKGPPGALEHDTFCDVPEVLPSSPALQARGTGHWERDIAGDHGRGAGHHPLPGLESGITRGKWRRDGLSGLQREPPWQKLVPTWGHPPPRPLVLFQPGLVAPGGRHKEQRVIHTHPPENVLAEGWEGVLLVVPEDLKYNRLALDVFDEGLGHLHSNLRERKST